VRYSAVGVGVDSAVGVGVDTHTVQSNLLLITIYGHLTLDSSPPLLPYMDT